MHLFKDTVAPEACPAKTAESISYGATFAVLGWLLFSNYSGFGYAEQHAEAIANVELPPADTFATAESINNGTATYTQATNETPFSATTPNQLEAEISNFDTTLPQWHAALDPYQQYESQAHQRAFSTAPWNSQTSDADRQIAAFIEGIALPLPLIDADFLLDAQSTTENLVKGDPASGVLGEMRLIREVTVTGTDADRLTNRPQNIQRPQIPRPYRAQEIQRSFALPPRIQALKP
jgi:hypothetical protein